MRGTGGHGVRAARRCCGGPRPPCGSCGWQGEAGTPSSRASRGRRAVPNLPAPRRPPAAEFTTLTCIPGMIRCGPGRVRRARLPACLLERRAACRVLFSAPSRLPVPQAPRAGLRQPQAHLTASTLPNTAGWCDVAGTAAPRSSCWTCRALSRAPRTARAAAGRCATCACCPPARLLARVSAMPACPPFSCLPARPPACLPAVPHPAASLRAPGCRSRVPPAPTPPGHLHGAHLQPYHHRAGLPQAHHPQEADRARAGG